MREWLEGWIIEAALVTRVEYIDRWMIVDLRFKNPLDAFQASVFGNL